MRSKLPNPVIEEIKDLISEGMTEAQEPGSPFLSLHQNLVRTYFEARNVEIDYQEETVKLEIPVAGHRYTKVNFDCKPLEQFLRSCTRADQKSLEYYKTLLGQFAAAEPA